MKKPIVSVLLLMLTITPVWANNAWKCVAQDQDKKQWMALNGYKRVAANKAMDACKKQSTAPISCSVTSESCEYDGGDQAVARKKSSDLTSWVCLSLDNQAHSWAGKPRELRDDAALEAKAYCQELSKVPDTCYINLQMCQKTGE